jgi:signal transduction histidine kinase
MDSGSMEPTDQSRTLHDLTNLLSVISARAESLRSRLPSTEQADPDFIELIRAVDRAILVARRRGVLAAPRVRARGAIDVNDFIDRMTPRLTHVVGSRLRLEIRTGGPAGTVRASWDQLENILLNLMLNASIATRDGGRIAVATSASSYVSETRNPRRSRPRRYIRLTVEDDGRGIPPDVQRRIAWHSSATESDRTGLGLDSIARTVRQLDGQLQIESDEGAGTSVHIDLPLD